MKFRKIIQTGFVAGLTALVLNCSSASREVRVLGPIEMATSKQEVLSHLGYKKEGPTADGRVVGCAEYGHGDRGMEKERLRLNLMGQLMKLHSYSSLEISGFRFRQRSESHSVVCMVMPGKFPTNQGRNGQYDAKCEIELYKNQAVCLSLASPRRAECETNWNQEKWNISNEINNAKMRCWNSHPRPFSQEFGDCIDQAVQNEDQRHKQAKQQYDSCVAAANAPYRKCLDKGREKFERCLGE